jgi:hypothetical protein
MMASALVTPRRGSALWGGMSRVWAMPNRETFAIPPIADLLDRWLPGLAIVLDPFARNSKRGTYRNDLDPTTTAESHLPATEWLAELDFLVDGVLFDPPYSPRQISECYRKVGLPVGTADTQNARLYREVRDALDRRLKPGGTAISFGWNSAGFGKERGYQVEEILLVCHGAAHNDTIVTVEQKMA